MESVDNDVPFFGIVFVVFVMAIVNLVIVKAILHRFSFNRVPIEIHPYEVAYLTGGKLLSIQAVICYLMANGILKVESSNGDEYIVQDTESTKKLSEMQNSSESSSSYEGSSTVVKELEKELCQWLDRKSCSDIEAESQSRSFSKLFDEIEKKLVSQGLLYSKVRRIASRILLWGVTVFPIALFLLIRIDELNSANQPIILESSVTLGALIFVTWFVTNLSVSKSKKADTFLTKSEDEFMRLARSFNNKSLSMTPDNFVRAFALSGSHIFSVIDEESAFRSFFFPEIKSLSECLEDEDEED